jgi:hypothetical protein
MGREEGELPGNGVRVEEHSGTSDGDWLGLASHEEEGLSSSRLRPSPAPSSSTCSCSRYVRPPFAPDRQHRRARTRRSEHTGCAQAGEPGQRGMTPPHKQVKAVATMKSGSSVVHRIYPPHPPAPGAELHRLICQRLLILLADLSALSLAPSHSAFIALLGCAVGQPVLFSRLLARYARTSGRHRAPPHAARLLHHHAPSSDTPPERLHLLPGQALSLVPVCDRHGRVLVGECRIRPGIGH